MTGIANHSVSPLERNFNWNFSFDNMLVGVHCRFILVGHSSCNLHEGTLVIIKIVTLRGPARGSNCRICPSRTTCFQIRPQSAHNLFKSSHILPNSSPNLPKTCPKPSQNPPQTLQDPPKVDPKALLEPILDQCFRKA